MSEPAGSMPRVPELGRFRLGEWYVWPTEGVLCSKDRSVRLEPRVMDVLACLAGDPGRVVTKEEFLAAVWGGAFVEEGVLSQAIHSLRKALGDDTRQPRYIQTIPKRGYRLLAPVMPEGKRQVPGPVNEIRIVVLPFENLGKSEDPDFAAGLTEEITANLSLLPMVQVIPGRNVLGDKGVPKPLSEVWKKLGVDYVLRGQVSCRRTGGRCAS